MIEVWVRPRARRIADARPVMDFFSAGCIPRRRRARLLLSLAIDGVSPGRARRLHRDALPEAALVPSAAERRRSGSASQSRCPARRSAIVRERRVILQSMTPFPAFAPERRRDRTRH